MGFPIGSQSIISIIRILYLSYGDDYTGGAFGASQGEKCPVAHANVCDFQRQQLPALLGAQKIGNGVTGNQGMDDAWDEDDGREPTWEDVLPTRGRETRRDGGGSEVAARLANPPSRPITTSSIITSATPPSRKQQHHEGTEDTVSYTACEGKSESHCHS